MNFIVTCEHAGNQVPECYSHIFTELTDVLESHRGWDPGALEIARFLATEFNAPLFICEMTRLLIEPNRSLHSHQLYSEYSRRSFLKQITILFFNSTIFRIEMELRNLYQKCQSQFYIFPFTPLRPF